MAGKKGMKINPNSLKNLTTRFRFIKGFVPWNKGKKASEATRKKISEANKGRSQTNQNSLKNLTARFPKGNIPWNKEIKGLHHSPKSEFKKGMTPWNKGKKLSKEHCENLSKSHQGQIGFFKGKKRPDLTGKNHPSWKGNKAGYLAIHSWMARTFGKANKCENPKCKYPRLSMRGKLMRAPKKFHWANKTGKYLRKRYDWMMLCPSCHLFHDRKFKIGIPKKWQKKQLA